MERRAPHLLLCLMTGGSTFPLYQSLLFSQAKRTLSASLSPNPHFCGRSPQGTTLGMW
ncbi:hypothetical protein BCR39DRAFT_511922 [Naematelia encephala]|uniref:Uncharacterized protein n=1 Tax=Naematelia encephala TaxID=71784 RepID=A0A1Y2BLV5_9TREE|nr:hypothetical protein BCR39DRAFT_511922 [Naematelia encephala]